MMRGYSLVELLLALSIVAGLALYTAFAADLATEKTDDFLTSRCDEALQYASAAGVSLSERFTEVCTN